MSGRRGATLRRARRRVSDWSGAAELPEGASRQLRLSRRGNLLVIGDDEAARWQGDGFVALAVTRTPLVAPEASSSRTDRERIRGVWDGDSVRGVVDAGTAGCEAWMLRRRR